MAAGCGAEAIIFERQGGFVGPNYHPGMSRRSGLAVKLCCDVIFSSKLQVLRVAAAVQLYPKVHREWSKICGRLSFFILRLVVKDVAMTTCTNMHESDEYIFRKLSSTSLSSSSSSSSPSSSSSFSFFFVFLLFKQASNDTPCR